MTMMISAGATGKIGDTGRPGKADLKPADKSTTMTPPQRTRTISLPITGASTEPPCYGLPGEDACTKSSRFCNSFINCVVSLVSISHLITTDNDVGLLVRGKCTFETVQVQLIKCFCFHLLVRVTAAETTIPIPRSQSCERAC